jgi:hypothetical protein
MTRCTGKYMELYSFEGSPQSRNFARYQVFVRAGGSRQAGANNRGRAWQREPTKNAR